MKLSEFKHYLSQFSELIFIQPNGQFVPSHFHITEVGLTTKHFIDCGGTVRAEKTISFQLWAANDTDHKLLPKKLSSIISMANEVLGSEDHEVEIEYQTETIGRYGIEITNNCFMLTPKFTNCLATDKCGIPMEKQRVSLSSLNSKSCAPGSGCCN